MADTQTLATVVACKDAPVAEPTRSSSARRFRPVIMILVIISLIGLGWVVEINTFLSHVHIYTVRLHADLTETAAVPPPATPLVTKQCARLNHRDPGFVRDETKNLCLSVEELAAHIREIVFAAADLFDAYNVTYFLESGTLLGSFREKGVIRKDQDADLGIDAAALQFLQQNPVQVPPAYHFTVWNSSLYPGSSRDDKLPVRLIHKETALYADVFAFLDWKKETIGQDEVGPLPSVCFGGCRKCPKVNGLRHFKVPRTWVYPLVDCLFDGRAFKCPRESAKYLEHMYGKSYMTPRRP